jgi:hypothetical protein
VTAESPPPDRSSDRRLWVLAALVLIVTATIVRFVVNFSTPYPPGTDAGYYPLQTRALMTEGRLMYDDLPLIFWLNAAVTNVLTLIGWESDAGLLLASRIVDCVGPPWAAAFVMAGGYDASGGRREAIAGSVAAATMVVLWPATFAMLSEFEKNSLGLVWMAAAAWACAAAMRRGGWRRWAVLGMVMGLSAVTHVGAFGVTLVMVTLALVFWVLPPGRAAGFRAGRPALITAAIVALPLLILEVVEPGRLRVLVHGPIEILGAGGRLGGGGQMVGVTLLCIMPIVVIGVRRLWKDRRELLRADIATVAAATLTTVALVLPMSSEYGRRLTLMSCVPAATILGFLLARRAVAGRSPWPGRAVVAGVVLIACVTVVNARHFVAPAQIDARDVEDLRSMRDDIPDPAATLVIGPHGLEWWVGYVLHTPVRVVSLDPKTYGSVRESVPANAFLRYRRVLVVLPAASSRPDRPVAPGAVSDPSLHLIHAGRVLQLFEWR